MMPVEKSARSFWLKTGTAALLCGVIVVAFLLFSKRPPQMEEPLPELERNALTLRDGKLYPADDEVPFTGKVIERYEDGSLKSCSVVSNGLLSGVSEGWHTNGVMQVREHFSNGISHGVREKWFESGSQLSESTIIEGKIEGTFWKWHENGHLAERIEMKQGEPDGVAQAFYPSGFLKTEANMRQGSLIQSKSWQDGEKESGAH